MTITTSKRQHPKTWSVLGDVRRKPSEYEVVTSNFHYHFRRSPAPFELDPNTPLNQWYLRYREGSPLQMESWEQFHDPHQFAYRHYVKHQDERETYIDNLVDQFEQRNADAQLDVDWVKTLETLYIPSRYALHVLQMVALYVGQMAPTSAIANAAYFQAADELRRVQWAAYRTKSLALAHYPELASTEATRHNWEEAPLWQPTRETLEKLLLAYDWGEAFTALNLVIKPIFDAVYNVELARLAEANGDTLLALMLDNFALDSKRNQDWSQALARYATKGNVQNTETLKAWVAKWTPLASATAEGLGGAFAQAPKPVAEADVLQRVEAAHKALLVGCGL